ncbi:MAG TPA: hypothetical protein ENK32_05430 [Anaerolineae bacterium]|nr:hypothetical protein [Anaerolineae bacterium]
MWEDSIVKEVRDTRYAHAAKFNFDLEAIYQDLKKQELAGKRQVVSFQPKPPAPVLAETQATYDESKTSS